MLVARPIDEVALLGLAFDSGMAERRERALSGHSFDGTWNTAM
jgi:hypothetical protein